MKYRRIPQAPRVVIARDLSLSGKTRAESPKKYPKKGQNRPICNKYPGKFTFSCKNPHKIVTIVKFGR